ncbi:MAG: DUF938 domain-containing protein [Proteobacteria bacterium]|nr:DUF938 domain-containing protein [Pseudomonadota bacterium]
MNRRAAPAAARNRDPILAVLRTVLPDAGAVLEIASGSGAHAVYFARALPKLRWRPSDPDAASRASIADWIDHEGLKNVDTPLALDVTRNAWVSTLAPPVDAMFCCNMIHIAPWEACLGLLEGAATLLPVGAPLVLYGPFLRASVPTAPSNVAFDASLRAQDVRWGIRDLELVTREAAARGLSRAEVIAMPANNLVLVFRRVPEAGGR